MTSVLATSPNPRNTLNKALDAYNALKSDFRRSSFLALAAIYMSILEQDQNFAQISKKAKEIYKIMRKRHPFLTSPDDSTYSIFLALSNKSVEEISSESEECYNLLKKHFFHRNSVQSLSNALALFDESSEQKVQRILEIYNSLKDYGYKYGTKFELASLASVATLPISVPTIIKDIRDVDKFLSAQKGYGLFGFRKKQRLLHSASLVASFHQKDEQHILTATITCGTLSMIIAQQAYLTAAVSASVVASTN